MDGCESGAEQLCVRWLRSLPWKLNVRWPAEETGVVVYVELDRPGLVPCPPDRGFYVDGAATDEVIVERLEHLEPGPELATLLMEIEIRGELSLPTRAAVVIGWHRLGAWVAAREAGATWAAVEQAGPGSMLARSVAREIACATGVSSGRVGRTADLGLGMATHTTLGHAMGAGAMDRDKAEAILRYTDHLDREQATPVIDQAVQGAGLLTLGQVRSRTRALAGWSDPAQAADRHERAMSRRDVWVETAGDAMSYVHAFIDAPSAERILTTLNALALDVADGPDRSTGAFRGDAQSQELSVASPPEPPSVLPPAQLSPRVFAEVSGEASAGTQAQLSPRVFAEVSGEASAGTQAQA
ncbi:MAG: 13E12 repeat family protein, partial [Bifidobacteriaceae bacterium]|nr:13E12 repeat family protein [Bifidobacteriaceae bacterium]